MITKWKLFNFKSIQEETELALGPLTILAGSNSSGKSTVLQSILLISQTLSSKVGSRPIVLNGPLVKLGQFDDLRSHNGEANQILIGWECRPKSSTTNPSRTPILDPDWRRYYRFEEGLRTVACEVSFEVDPADPKRDLLQLHPRFFGCTLEVNLETRGASGMSRLSVNRSTKDPRSKATDPDSESSSDQVKDVSLELLSLLENDVLLTSNLERESWDGLAAAEIVGCDLVHFLPNRLVIRFDSVKEEADQIVAALTNNILYGYRAIRNHPHGLIIPPPVIEVIRRRLGEQLTSRMLSRRGVQFSRFPNEGLTIQDFLEGERLLSEGEQQLVRSKLTQEVEALTQEIRQAMAVELGKKYELTQTPLTEEIHAATVYLNRFFITQVKYLGPLRDEPKPLYPLASNVDPTDIGYRGEHTAAVLDLHKDKFIRYLPAANFEKAQLNREPTTRTLERAVFDWLNYMEVAENLVTRDRGKLGHELKVTTAGNQKPHDLTHVGVGVSQVLPILVMCLLAEPDTTLIIEQPELHLHPKVQTLLGDFFLSMAMLEKQIIVETHSEYIINRLRFRAASAEDENVANKLKIYFVEKRKGASYFREVNVNQYGAIIDWPEGFFDQSQSEAEDILRAATRKRKAERQREQDAKRND